MKKVFKITEAYKKAYLELKAMYDQSHLKKDNVTLPKINTARAIDLTYCYLHLSKVYREEDMRKYYENITGDNTWRQPRHLGAQFGWNHYIGGEILPNGYKLKNGEFCLWDIDHCKKGYNPSRRSKDPITNEEFEILKAKYGYKCANCKAKEGLPHPKYPDKIVKLQKGHMNPNKPLMLNNCIPQCQCCNQGAINHWQYNKAGEIYAPNTPDVVMRNKNPQFRLELLNKLLIWKNGLKSS